MLRRNELGPSETNPLSSSKISKLELEIHSYRSAQDHEFQAVHDSTCGCDLCKPSSE